MRPFWSHKWGRKRSREEELRDELQFHLEEEAEEQHAAGAPVEDARWAARRELGNLALVAENTRAAWTWTFLEQLLQDLRYARRTMGAPRGFTALAVTLLALGIGANTAIFSFMDALLLRRLPVAEPSSLVVVNWSAKTTGRTSVVQRGYGRIEGNNRTGHLGAILPYPAFELMQRGGGDVFSAVFARFAPGRFNLTIGGQADVAAGEYVTGEYFSGLGVIPAAGRLILPEDDRAGAPPVVILSASLSESRFGSPANAIGRSVLVNNVPFTVAGVAPRGFSGVDPEAPTDFFLPLQASRLLTDSVPEPTWFPDGNYYWLHVMARLRPGVTLAQAQAKLAGPYHRWVESTALSDTNRAGLPVLALRAGGGGIDAIRFDFERPLWILAALVALILLMACTNIASLLLARASRRRREMAIRLSIGAGRRRVIRQLLTESVLLSVIGGVFGVAVAVWGIQFLSVLLGGGPDNVTLTADLNWRVLAAAAGFSLLSGILFGLAPAIQATRIDLQSAMKEALAAGMNGRGARLGIPLGGTLIAGQIAITLTMLVAAGLFARTLANLNGVEMGFSTGHLLTFRLDAPQSGVMRADVTPFYDRLRDRLRADPGILGATLAQEPLIGRGTWFTGFAVPGAEPQTTDVLMVGADFFQTIQVPILRGRPFDTRDRHGAPLVAIVNQQFAARRFEGRDPIGARITEASDPPRELEIVGVSGNARYGSLESEIGPVIYVPYAQESVAPVGGMTFVLRTAGDPSSYTRVVRDVVRKANPLIPITDLLTGDEQVARTIHQQIAFARLCLAFAVLALAIACVGLYGTVSFHTARRTAEIGIRMALGAPRMGVVGMVLREVAVIAAAGLAIGLPAVLAASKLVKSFLFHLEPNDPLSLAASVAILASAAGAAGAVPAWRASRVDPMTALRHE